ncbi:MAG: T9SS type A sorting domain-containing protein [Cyclobacteriaceae bacterium]|nr:T9SS type A sorting domain-containing protein [Cyclobacteriaceae bacterium]
MILLYRFIAIVNHMMGLRIASGISILFFILLASHSKAQTYSFTTAGNMESGNWAGVPGATNLVVSFQSGAGIGSTTALKTVTSSMGGDTNYIIRGDQVFPMVTGDKITVSFWAKSSVANMRLQPWVQESDGNTWMNFGDAYLTTSWKQYQFTVTLTTSTSNNYKVKFRGYNTGTMYIDNVNIGPVDYENVAQSGIYDVTLSQNSMTWPINTFRSTCPTYSLGYQGMQSKDQNPLDLFANRTINYTKFSYTNPITVHVNVLNTTKVPVAGQTVRILPSRFGITSTTSGNVVTFTITEPGQYSVEIGDNGYKNGLIIFADPTETSIPSKTDPLYKVVYEATAGSLSSLTGYTGIYFRRGVHDIGIFTVPSNIKNIYFEDGSWVYGALKMDANPNVKIFGRGVLSAFNLNYRSQHSVEAINGSNNIIVEGLVVADPKYFGIRLIGTGNTVNYAKVIGGWVYNMDGISAYAGSNVSKCFIWANDDAIKVYRDSLTWSDIVVWQLNNGGIIQMSWGGDVGGVTANNVKISRVDVLRAEWDVSRFNTGLLNCVGNKYHYAGWSHSLTNWLIEDVVTENPIPQIFNITPDPFSHTHIDGLYLKNWKVKMTMGTSFQNQIKGEDAADFLSGFVFDNVKFNNKLLTNINYITNGDMETGNWSAVPKTTDQVVTLGAGLGVGSTTGLRSVVTNMNGSTDYAMKSNELFHMDHNEEITISFWAKATAAGKRLVSWVQETDASGWMNIGDVNLTTGWEWYTATANISPISSDNYQVKFRGYATAYIYIDKVQIGPPDWRTIMVPEIQYLDTPTFLPNVIGARTAVITEVEKSFKNGTVYPNPAKNALNLDGYDEGTVYQVYGMQGELYSNGKGLSVDLSQLAPGMYFLLINGTERHKFIKQ